MRNTPALVAKLAHACDAWVVGSSANPDNSEPRDWDVLVPFTHWQSAAMLIPLDARPNTFGGFKCISEGVEVDVWPGELGWLLQRPGTQWVWHPASGVRFRKRGFDNEKD